MDATTYSTLFFNGLEMISKSYNMKYSKKAFCAYQKLGDNFWSASFICRSFLVDGQLEVTVDSCIKPCAFDAIQFSIIEPGKNHRITDMLRVNASFAARPLQIDSKTYYLPCDNPANFSATLDENLRIIFSDLIEKRTTFLTSNVSNDDGLLPYLFAHQADFPFESGMAYLCKDDYNAAKQCFELAEKSNSIVTKSIGKPGRYLHLVFIDYCIAMQSGIEWSDYLVANGLSADAT